MIKKACSPTKYILVVRDKRGVRVSSAASPKDLPETRVFALSLMQLTNGAVSADVYDFVPGWKLENASEPVETVQRKTDQ